MPGPPLALFRSDAGLPACVDVVVIGGGIVGCCTALELLERGLSVAVCEKGVVAGEQSSRNWGWVRVSRRDAREIPLMVESLRLWRGLGERLGEDVGYRSAGITFVAGDAAELARQEQFLAQVEPFQLQSQLLDAAGVARRFPGVRFDGLAALHTPQDGRAEPQRVGPAIAQACQRLGGHVLAGCAVRGIDVQAGRVSGVITELGAIASDAVVLAGGAWSSLLCAQLGIRLPQLKVLNSVLRTSRIDGGPDGALWTRDYAFRRRADGGYSVANGHHNVAGIVPDSFRYLGDFLPSLRAEWHSLSLRIGRESLREWHMPRRWALDEPSPFEAVRVLDPKPASRFTLRSFDALKVAAPAFRDARVLQHWGGMIDVTPDAIPVMSDVGALPGFYLATGFSGHGFGIAPAAGRLMADIVTGTPPLVDPDAFRFSRFSDGSPIVLDR